MLGQRTAFVKKCKFYPNKQGRGKILKKIQVVPHICLVKKKIEQLNRVEIWPTIHTDKILQILSMEKANAFEQMLP